jgi:hypothetical protein
MGRKKKKKKTKHKKTKIDKKKYVKKITILFPPILKY